MVNQIWYNNLGWLTYSRVYIFELLFLPALISGILHVNGLDNFFSLDKTIHPF
jgi:hypothetical protein